VRCDCCRTRGVVQQRLLSKILPFLHPAQLDPILRRNDCPALYDVEQIARLPLVDNLVPREEDVRD
jgi:hypothetical protein